MPCSTTPFEGSMPLLVIGERKASVTRQLFSAALEAEREVQIVEKLGQASCHPILVTLPESEYLKGFVCRVI
jgi:23S rRNA G2069 N7-methylase RlmK/C1962 C5-methylase RlmI